MQDSLRKKIRAWREQIGYREALKAFDIVGIPKGTAQKLLAGTYNSQPGRLLLQAIDKAMKEDW